jgi:hypothetical protein
MSLWHVPVSSLLKEKGTSSQRAYIDSKLGHLQSLPSRLPNEQIPKARRWLVVADDEARYAADEAGQIRSERRGRPDTF